MGVNRKPCRIVNKPITALPINIVRIEQNGGHIQNAMEKQYPEIIRNRKHRLGISKVGM